MQKIMSKPLSYLCAFLSCLVFSFATGCASGGFKLTKKYAGFVNSQNIFLRIILYLLTGIVFAVTLFADFIIFNTMDFWEGKVSAGSYNFKDGEKTFHVQHEYQPDGQLRRSTIRAFDENNVQMQEVVLNETAAGEIEMFVDGKLRTKVHSISELPTASLYDENGKFLKQTTLLLDRTAVTTASR